MDRELWVCGQLTGEYCGRGTPWEFQGIFSSEAKADAACRNETYFIYPVQLDVELPDDPIDAPKARYPRATPSE